MMAEDEEEEMEAATTETEEEETAAALSPPCDCTCICCGVNTAGLPAAVREALRRHQQAIQKLCRELEEERNAVATAASETMSMILRLQKEKAEIQMEARQFKRFAEEKMAHDQHEIAALEDLLFKRDQTVQSLSCEVQAYKHRLLRHGIIPSATVPTPAEPPTPDAATSSASSNALSSQIDLPLPPPPPSSSYDYPPLRCTGSPSFSRAEEFPVMVDRAWDCGGRDDMSDRGYAVDAVHPVMAGGRELYMSTPSQQDPGGVKGGEFRSQQDPGGVKGGEVRRQHVRHPALEADRESMMQAILSIGVGLENFVEIRR